MNINKNKEVEQHLLQMRNQVIQSIMMLMQDKNKKKGPLTQDLDDQSISVENDQVVDELERLERNELQDIDNALTRIKHGTYARCINCSEEIESKRLKAIPYALYCMNCESDKN